MGYFLFFVQGAYDVQKSSRYDNEQGVWPEGSRNRHGLFGFCIHSEVSNMEFLCNFRIFFVLYLILLSVVLQFAQVFLIKKENFFYKKMFCKIFLIIFFLTNFFLNFFSTNSYTINFFFLCEGANRIQLWIPVSAASSVLLKRNMPGTWYLLISSCNIINTLIIDYWL